MANTIPKLSDPTPLLEVVRIFISSGHGYWTKHGAGRLTHGIEELSEVECLAGKGLRGDRYATGELDRIGQVTFISEEAIEAIREEFRLPELPASIFRRNIVVRGAALADLLGAQFEIQSVQFLGAQECRPCEWMERVVAPGAKKFMQENFRGGLRAKILTDGILRATASQTS